LQCYDQVHMLLQVITTAPVMLYFILCLPLLNNNNLYALMRAHSTQHTAIASIKQTIKEEEIKPE